MRLRRCHAGEVEPRHGRLGDAYESSKLSLRHVEIGTESADLKGYIVIREFSLEALPEPGDLEEFLAEIFPLHS